MRRSRFFGRDADLTRLANLLADHRLVTVTGVGGVGKTRLIDEARPLLNEIWGDQVALVSLADIEPDADATIVSAQIGMSSPEAVAVRHRDGCAVVVLDNCEHLVEGAADFAARVLAAGDAVSVLATSRVPLGVPDEQVLVLEPLGLPASNDPDPMASPSVALFTDRAEASGGRWERTDEAVEAVVELCRRLDGLPLAIELAAARTRALSPPELLALMERRLEALHTPQAGRPLRHRSVRAALDVSVEALDDEARSFFHRLGVFVGAFDIDLAHAVAGPRPDDRLRTVDLMGELVDRSLLVAEPGDGRTRYRLLELVREYCADELRVEGAWDATNELVTDVMVVEADRLLTAAATSWSGEVVSQLGERFGDFDTGVRWCIAHDERADRAYRLFVALYAGIHLSRSSEVRALGELLLERWPESDAAFRGEVLAVLATAYAIASYPDRGAELAQAALDAPGVTLLGRVVAHRALLLTALGRDDVPTARAHAEQGRFDAATAGVAPFERELRGFEASLLDRAGCHDEAVAIATEAIQTSVAASDPITEIWARLVAATIAMRAKRFGEARAQLDRASQTSVVARDMWWGGPLLRSQGFLQALDPSPEGTADGWDASRATWRTAIERASRLGDLGELALSLRSAAAVATRDGRLDVAAVLLDAVPPTSEMTMLPSPFDEPLPVPPERTGPRERPTIIGGLRRALAAIDEPDEAAQRGTPDEPAAPSGKPVVSSLVAAVRREGDVWAITYKGASARVRDLKGVRDIANLLGRPGQDVHCLELMGAAHVQDSAGPALDDRARREYQARIVDLQTEIDEARAANDPNRADRAEVELDALVQQLSEAFGISGRARERGSSAERARTAVTYRIRAAIRRVAEVHPDLGRHLDNAVRTGTWCSYRPDSEITWQVEHQ